MHWKEMSKKSAKPSILINNYFGFQKFNVQPAVAK